LQLSHRVTVASVNQIFEIAIINFGRIGKKPGQDRTNQQEGAHPRHRADLVDHRAAQAQDPRPELITPYRQELLRLAASVRPGGSRLAAAGPSARRLAPALPE